MAGHMPRATGSLHVQPGLIGLRGRMPSTDSPSSVSLAGLAGLEAAQGSLTSNALFGSLNLVRSRAFCFIFRQLVAALARCQIVAAVLGVTILTNLVLLWHLPTP
jgi:hypothetical protein